MRIAGVDYPDALLNALRDDQLVVFAGAGVSMGPPAGLPDFGRLALLIAEGTGESIADLEPVDQFLERLKDRGTDVHARAAWILQQNSPEPTTLHQNLLRLFREPEEARIVTTNFDELFEKGSLAQFDSKLNLFQAPVLPLGNRFRGIVHMHGSVSEPEEMILTHEDFGRAYLTESGGWASRFVMELFAKYTVLFVGYSHNDTIMTYLTPSLPPGASKGLFALIGEKSPDPAHWRRMAIEPIVFHQSDVSDYSKLDEAVAKLADFKRRGVLEWQSAISIVASAMPSTDDDAISAIEHALTEPTLTRFFVDSAAYPEWIDWLDRRGHLSHLFASEDLEERHMMLSYWLASRFVERHPDVLFSVIERHVGRLNPHFWEQLVWHIGKSDNAHLDSQAVSRWVHLLAGCVPQRPDESLLSNLAGICAKVGAYQNLLQVIDILVSPGYQVRPPPQWASAMPDLRMMKSLWDQCLEPNLPYIGYSLLERTTMRLEERRSAIVAWGKGDETWDGDSFSRSAIEPHEQDSIPQHIFPLIDVARDCLEWLSTRDPTFVEAWYNRFASSDTPLLRRLAIHAMAARKDLDSDEKIDWLLKQCDVNEFLAHHEIFRAAGLAYPQASSRQRKALIRAVSNYQAQESEHYDSDETSAHHRFNWFHWLREAEPQCSIVNAALDAVSRENPGFVSIEHPDFTHWSGASRVTSSWAAENLLESPVTQLLPDLLAYQPTSEESFRGNGRREMLTTVNEAAKANPVWGLDLADGLSEGEEWESDIWYHLITAWQNDELDSDCTGRVLSHISTTKLHQQHSREIAGVLTKLARSPAMARTEELSRNAQSIANALRPYAALSNIPSMTSSIGGVPQYVTWLNKAINHTSGKLAEFWTFSIDMWRKQQEVAPQSLNPEYRDALDSIISEEGIPGKLGRTVLASNFHFFLAVDEEWTVTNLLPLFNSDNEDFQCSWDGFLTWGRLSPDIAELLHDDFLAAVPRVIQDFEGEMSTRFVEFYTIALGWLIECANDDWITEFFRHADEKAKGQFADAIEQRLSNLDETSQQEWWNAWLREYWANRLQGVPSPLNDAEIAGMLDWVLYLPSVLPEVVDLAVQMRTVPLSRLWASYVLRESNLIERYPNELATFLVHLGKCDTQPWFWLRLGESMERLLANALEPDLEKSIRGLMVRHGLK